MLPKIFDSHSFEKMGFSEWALYSNFETPYYSTGYSNSSMTVAFDSSKGDNGAVKLTSNFLQTVRSN